MVKTFQIGQSGNKTCSLFMVNEFACNRNIAKYESQISHK